MMGVALSDLDNVAAAIYDALVAKAVSQDRKVFGYEPFDGLTEQAKIPFRAIARDAIDSAQLDLTTVDIEYYNG